MRRLIAALAVLLVAVGAVSAWASSRGSENASAAFVPMKGTFKGLGHRTDGTARLVRTAGGRAVVLGADFQTRPAPELFFYLVRGRSKGAIQGGVKLGRVQSLTGGQQYRVPNGYDPGARPTLVLWCAKCQAGFAIAELHST